MWSDGETYDFTNLILSDPNPSGDCLTTDEAGYWQDDLCTEMFSFICKKFESMS